MMLSITSIKTPSAHAIMHNSHHLQPDLNQQPTKSNPTTSLQVSVTWTPCQLSAPPPSLCYCPYSAPHIPTPSHLIPFLIKFFPIEPQSPPTSFLCHLIAPPQPPVSQTGRGFEGVARPTASCSGSAPESGWVGGWESEHIDHMSTADIWTIDNIR